MRPLLIATLAALATLLAPARASAVDPQEIGEMNAEIEAKQKAVKEKYGNRTPREMSQEEKKTYEHDMNDAKPSTLKDHHASAREFELGALKLGHDDRAKSEEAKKGWGDKQAKKAAEEAKKAEEAKAAASKEPEVKVIKGFDEKNPNGIDDKTGGKGEGTEIPLPKEGNDAPAPK